MNDFDFVGDGALDVPLVKFKMFVTAGDKPPPYGFRVSPLSPININLSHKNHHKTAKTALCHTSR